MRVRRIRPGHKIAALLVAAQGQPVPIACIKELMKNDPTLQATDYKLSGYVGDIRKYDLGVVRIVKEGRAVVSYQLMNFAEFNEFGQNIKLTPKVEASAPEPEQIVTNLDPTPADTSIETLVTNDNEVGHVSNIVIPTEVEIVVNPPVTDDVPVAEVEEDVDLPLIIDEPVMDRNARRRAARAAAKEVQIAA